MPAASECSLPHIHIFSAHDFHIGSSLTSKLPPILVAAGCGSSGFLRADYYRCTSSSFGNDPRSHPCPDAQGGSLDGGPLKFWIDAFDYSDLLRKRPRDSMPTNLFSVPIFLICFREVLEAAIILSVLLALVEQLVKPSDRNLELSSLCPSKHLPSPCHAPEDVHRFAPESEHLNGQNDINQINCHTAIIKRLRLQIFWGTFTGLFFSLCIGAAFLTVYYTKLNDIYGKSEELWEGIFSLIACGMIFVMGITMMKMDRSKIKWRIKLSKAFKQGDMFNSEGRPRQLSPLASFKSFIGLGKQDHDPSVSSSQYLMFFLPAATVLREGLEAVVFIGGVSLGQPATSIPIAALTGIILGLLMGYGIYSSSSRLNLSFFLTISTIFLMYIAAGLITKSVWYFTMYRFIRSVGGDVAEAGDGPGSFPVNGYIWHLNYGNPENKLSAGGWMIFAGVFGWNNTGTILTVMTYIGFWLLVSLTLMFMKWKEGRCTIFNKSSAARKRRLSRLALKGPVAETLPTEPWSPGPNENAKNAGD
ncbi:hypothetical protein O181_030154 [Austropuccinia psidii MF-1]|uniref:High-affinity iron permease n=1 Tax=Austropuccinia psidii MF-1 TaxID=1389203 RepID=A0A9Q3CSA7_9BASI|nr:hypothetical protein [Austropuccinia psidii MF-1]